MRNDSRFDGDVRDGAPMSSEPDAQIDQDDGFTGMTDDPDGFDDDGIGFDDDHEELQAATGDFFKMPSFDQSETAMRARRKMKITIIVAVILVIILIVAAYFILSDRQQERRSDTIANEELISSDDIDSSTHAGSDYATTVPRLTSLVGMSLSDASSSLGTDYVSTAEETDSDSADADEGEATSVTLVYMPSDADEELDGAPEIVLEADEDGNVTRVVLTSEMGMVGVNAESFAELVETSETISWLLEQAGVTSGVESYTAPSADDYTTYVDPEAEERVVSRESSTFSGTISGSSAPTSWQVVLTFDYGQVNSGQSDEPVKTVQITLE